MHAIIKLVVHAEMHTDMLVYKYNLAMSEMVQI